MPLASPIERSLMKYFTFLGFTSPLAVYAVQPVRLHPILLISILLYCYEQLSGWILKVEQKKMMV